MSYLSDAKIIDLVKGYISENIYNYAIMINGAWGSGKTYFVKEVLVPKLEKSNTKRKAIYVSLYGLKSNDEIANCLLTSVIELRMGKTKKMLPFLRVGVNILTDVIGEKLGSKTIHDINEGFLSPFISYDDYYFIFDDLERCSMPVNEVLGYINNFVEQNNAKVLLVTYEEEIGSVKLLENKLMRYFIATQDTVSWPEKEKLDFFGNSVRKQTTFSSKPTLEDVEHRMELLTEENTFYLQVKEKLVGQTVYYQPDLKTIVPLIFSKCINIDVACIEQLFIEKICAMMEAENYYNLRTLQFSLSFIAKIRNEYPESIDNSKAYFDMMLEILEAVMKVSIYYKRQGKSYKWADNSEYGLISLRETFDPFRNYFKSFKFVHDYIYYGDYDITHIQEILNMYLKEQTAQQDKLNDPINILRDFWEMEDEVIEAHLKKLFCNLQSGKYKGILYRYILSLLFKLKGIGFEPISTDTHIAIMKENISNGETVGTMHEPYIAKNDPLYNDYLSSFAELEEMEALSSRKEKNSSMNNIFMLTSGWGTEFEDYCSENKDAFLRDRAFFKQMDIDSCYSAIEKGSVKDINHFWLSICLIYNFNNLKDFYPDDADNVKKLLDLLSNKEFKSRMKKFTIDMMSENLRSLLERLK